MSGTSAVDSLWHQRMCIAMQSNFLGHRCSSLSVLYISTCTKGNRKIGTVISETSKRVPVFPMREEVSKKTPLLDRKLDKNMGIGTKP